MSLHIQKMVFTVF